MNRVQTCKKKKYLLCKYRRMSPCVTNLLACNVKTQCTLSMNTKCTNYKNITQELKPPDHRERSIFHKTLSIHPRAPSYIINPINKHYQSLIQTKTSFLLLSFYLWFYLEPSTKVKVIVILSLVHVLIFYLELSNSKFHLLVFVWELSNSSALVIQLKLSNSNTQIHHLDISIFQQSLLIHQCSFHHELVHDP